MNEKTAEAVRSGLEQKSTAKEVRACNARSISLYRGFGKCRIRPRMSFCVSVTGPYIKGMAKEHPHAGATFRVVPQKDLTFGVEVQVPGSFPTMVTSFATEEAAEGWIADYKRRVTENVPHRYMRGRASRN